MNNLRDELLTIMAEKHGVSIELINLLGNIQVKQHAQRLIAEMLLSYPSLIKKLAENADSISTIDIVMGRGISKPEIVIDFEKKQALLAINQ